ncbi:MAG: DUF1990 family protein [Rufibacter sp.]
MKIFLTDQTKSLEKHLEFLKGRSVMAYDRGKLVEKATAILLPKFPHHLQFLFNYQIFPGNIMSALGQWQIEERSMRAGDTIVQQVYLPPIKSFSQKIIFGVRIAEVIEEPHRKGFSYETLEGHVEKGVSTFTMEEVDQKPIFKIHTFSSPGSFLSRIVGPIFSVPYQRYCTKKALENVKQQLETDLLIGKAQLP